MSTLAKTRKRIAYILLALALVFGLVPFTCALPAQADDGNNIDAHIEELLSAGRYQEGEAIAVLRADLSVKADSSLMDALLSRPNAESLLDSGEILMATSVSVAEEGLGVELPDSAQLVADGDSNDLSVVAADEDSAIEIVFVARSDMSTRELLRLLYDNPRVIVAEPNYIARVDDGDTEDSTSNITADSVDIAIGDSSKTAESSASSEEVISEQSDSLVAALQNTVQDGGFPVDSTSGFYDFSSLQWAYTGYVSSLKRPSTVDASCSTPGIENWNSAAGKNNAAGTVVAVMDTGVDYTNQDIKNVMISGDNSQISIACGGGQYGFNAVGDGEDPTTDCQDYAGHGTHCAGIIAAEWNGFGTSGAADGVQILSVRVFAEGSDDEQMRDIVKGYEYLCRCKDAGMNLVAVNCSWGYDLCQKSILNLVVTELGRKGVVSISAAGNADYDNDIHAATRTMLAENPYVVTVSSSDAGDVKSGFSSYGQMSSNVFAGGSEILSTYSATLGSRLYGPADAQPLYRNYFETDNLSQNLWISAVKTRDTGSLICPKTVDELGDFASDAASWTDEVNVDAAAGSGSVVLTKSGTYWLALPVKNEDIPSLSYISVHCSSAQGQSSYPYCYLCSISKDSSGKIAANHMLSLISPKTWRCVSANLTDGLNDTSELYTLPLDEDTSLVLFLCDLNNVNESNPFYLDALSLHEQSAISSAGGWTIMNGTSMAAPYVSGCAAIVAANPQKYGLSETDTARSLANYLKGHVRTVSDFANLCTQGGIVDLTIADGQETPVINSAKQDKSGDTASRSVTLRGAYFGKTQGVGGVSIGGAAAYVTSWSDDCIVVQVASSVGSGEQLIEVKSNNGKTGRYSMLFQNSSDGQAHVFPQTLSTPNQCTDIQTEVLGLFTGDYNYYPGLITNQLVSLNGKLYLSARDAKTERFSKIYAYDPKTDTWSIAVSFADNQTDAWTYCSIAALNGRIWCYGAKSVYGKTGADAQCTPVMFSFNPKNSTCEQIDVSALGQGLEARFINSTLVAFRGSLMLVGGMGGTQQLMTADNIALLSISNGSLSYVPVCTLPDLDGGAAGVAQGAVGAQVAVVGDSLYLGAFASSVMNEDADSESVLAPTLVKVTYNQDRSWSCEDISKALPSILWTDNFETTTGYLPMFSLASTQSTLFISGANVAADVSQNTATQSGESQKTARSAFDTYLLDKDSSEFKSFSYAADLGTLFYPTSVVMDGYLYTLGSTKYDEGNNDDYIFRRVLVEDSNQGNQGNQGNQNGQGDGGQTIVATGDSTRIIFVGLSIVCLIASACIALSFRRQVH